MAKQTGRDDMVVWQGTCIVHETFSEKKILDLLMRNPGAELIAHPECEEPVLRHAQYIGSTTGLIKYAVSSPAQTFIVATEEGVLHQMKRGRAATRRSSPRRPRTRAAPATSARTCGATRWRSSISACAI